MMDIATAQDNAYRIAARNGEALANRVYDNAVGLTYFAVNRASEFFRIAEDCAARADWVGAWSAYGGVVVTVQDDQRYSLLKTDEHGRTI